MRKAAAVCALLSTGLLAGAFGYGWANVVPAFAHVPLGVHLSFRIELMKWNAPTMQTLMALSVLSSVGFALTMRSAARALAAAAALLNLTAALITKYGNVPINLQIKQWVSTALPRDYAAQLHTWDIFNAARVAAALGAFLLIIIATQGTPRNNPPTPTAEAGSISKSLWNRTPVATSPLQPSAEKSDRH